MSFTHTHAVHCSYEYGTLTRLIDEVTNNKHIRIFSSTFQILLREDLPVFLLMTGPFENIHDLENEKSLTFLYRAPKITLEPLSLSSIELSYQRIFQISSEKAIEMAKLTHGYAFAYQVLGYLLWESETHELSDSIIHMYDRYLEEYVYEKIWSQLSGNDRIVIWAIADSVSYQISDILKLSGMKKNALSVYRDRLTRRYISERKYAAESTKVCRIRIKEKRI